MAGSLNKVQLIGHLGRDPEIRSMNNGSKVANFSIATSESWRDKQSGERKEKTEWHNVVVWNEGLIKVVDQYLKKGSKVYVEGSLQTRKWEKNGEDRYSTEIVLKAFDGKMLMLDGKSEGGSGGDYGRSEDRGGGGRSSGGGQRSGGGGGSGGGGSYAADLDDDIPF